MDYQHPLPLVNVLEISEGGISGDVTMQENKFLEIIKNEEQMAKLTPVNEDDKKAPICRSSSLGVTVFILFSILFSIVKSFCSISAMGAFLSSMNLSVLKMKEWLMTKK
jgi:hypothetical protein